VLPVVVDGIKLSHDLGDLVRAVEVERHRPVLDDRVGLAVRVWCERAPGRRINDLPQPREALDPLEQLQRRDQVVLVVGERVCDRALVAVVGREMEDEVVLVVELREHGVVGDRALDERDAWVVRHVLALRGEEVVHHEHATRVAREQLAGEVATDEPGAADDEGAGPAELAHCAGCFSGSSLRCV
jgi:hypothetical protein